MSTVENRRANSECLARLGDVMDANELHALARRPQRCGERTAEPFARAPATAESADEGFAGCAEHHGASCCMEQREPRQEREIVRILLAEADAGIDGDALARNARGLTGGDASFQEIEDVESGIVVAWILLHGAGIARHVHEDDGGAALGG